MQYCIDSNGYNMYIFTFNKIIFCAHSTDPPHINNEKTKWFYEPYMQSNHNIICQMTNALYGVCTHSRYRKYNVHNMRTIN